MPLLAQPPLVLAPGHVIRLTRASVETAPREACGVLLGEVVRGERQVRRLTVAENLAEEPDRFFIDPVHLMRQVQHSAANGLEILGVWHSHLGQPASPSRLDTEGSLPGWTQLIARIDDGVLTDLKVWDTVEGELEESKVFMDTSLAATKDAPASAHGLRGSVARWVSSQGPLEA
jgi:proteasome lid subunit RPN8/RPN11